MTFYLKNAKHTHTRSARFFIHPLAILFLILAVSPLACAPGTPTATSNLASVTFIAEADAQVIEDQPDTNAGTSAVLEVEGGNDPDAESFLRFTVTGISSPVQNARLRLYNLSDASRNGPVIYATDTSWSEAEITWNSKPPRRDKELGNLSTTDRDAWQEYDVTAAVTGDGTFSFVLIADSSDSTAFSSREGSQPPQLVIAFADDATLGLDSANATLSSPASTATSSAAAPGAPVLIAVEADARVSLTDPNTNYGEAPILRANGAADAQVESFLRFRVDEIPGTIQRARLRLFVTDNGTENGPAIYATDNSWNEKSITWDNRPARIDNVLDNKDELITNSWVEFDVTPVVTGSGTFSFVLVSDSSDGVVFSSREGDQPPQLVIDLIGDTVPTAEGS